MANVDFGRYKRIVQYFWDPEPQNDDNSQASIWCLGKEYRGRSPPSSSADKAPTGTLEADIEPVVVPAKGLKDDKLNSRNVEGLTMGSLTFGEDRGWPNEFLDDLEARFWFTYRSHFSPIKKSTDPNVASSMSISVRLRSQLVDQGGFTSDTGWGCMIRSGQCLLANTLGILRLGRGCH